MGGGGTATLTATILPENADNKAVTWTSSNTEVATVDQNGLVTAIKEGFTAITVTTQDGGKTATCQIQITPYVIKMVTKKNVGEKVRLVMNVANEADKESVWIDLNNNGKKDTGEDNILFTNSVGKDYHLESQTIAIYGKVTLLYCDNNRLTQLDVSKNPLLTKLGCYVNNLTQLDVSNNKALTWLICSTNELTQLNVFENRQLNVLDCEYNKLTKEGMANLLSSLPHIKGAEKGAATIIGNPEEEKNYNIITDQQKQEAKDKNWELLVYNPEEDDFEVINP